MRRRQVLAFAGATLAVPVSGLADAPNTQATLYLIHSIDATTDDNGALNCNRRHARPYLPNASTVDVVSNFLSCASSGSLLARICGHAAPGHINTHCGQHVCGPDKYISNWNQYYWEPIVELLRGVVGRLELWGCHPGADENGADLLFALATAVRCNVAGISGFMYCGQNSGITFEPGSVWVEATPTQRPTPVKPPSLLGGANRLTPSGIVIERAEGRTSVPTASIDYVEVRAVRQDPLAPAPTVLLRGDEMRNALRFVRLDAPIPWPGEPLALLTAHIRVGFSVAGRDEVLNLSVWNDLLATDDTGRVAYPLDPSFEGFRRSLAID